MKHFVHLHQFLAGYFHQDWALEAPDADEVVRKFKAVEPPEVVRKVAAEIKLLLSRKMNEPQRRALLFDELGCEYDPAGDGLTTSAWLAHVGKLLA